MSSRPHTVPYDNCDATKEKLNREFNYEGAMVCAPVEVYGKAIDRVRIVDPKFCSASSLKARWGLNARGEIICVPAEVRERRALEARAERFVTKYFKTGECASFFRWKFEGSSELPKENA